MSERTLIKQAFLLIQAGQHTTADLDHLLDTMIGDQVVMITPRPLNHRGCQVSLRIAAGGHGPAVQRQLELAGVSCDFRHPDVIRVAPVPLYNSYKDIHRFVSALGEILP